MKSKFSTTLTLLFLIAVFFIAKAESFGCDPLNCDPQPWSYATKTVFLPNYPDCPVQVGYYYRTCFGVYVEMRIVSYSFNPSDDPDCQDLLDDQQKPDGSPDWDEIGDTFVDLHLQLSKDLFEAFYNSLPSASQSAYHCGQGGSKTYSSQWSPCVEYEVCFSDGPWEVSINDCEENVCCLIETIYCWDTQTNEPVVTVNYFPQTGSCGDPQLGINFPCITYGCVPFCGSGKQSINEPGFQSAGDTGFIQYVNIAPNPFDSEATISYELLESADVEIKLYDMFGRQVISLPQGLQSSGSNSVSIHARNLPNGVYTFQIQAGEHRAGGQLNLAK